MTIATEGLSKRYGKSAALDSVTFSVPKGSISALVGKNGAGKSTLLHILAGLTRADSGKIQVDGSPPSQDPHWLSGVGFVDQVASMTSNLTPLGLSKVGRDLNSTWRQDEFLLRLDELEIPSGRRIGKLSGGQKHAVAVLMALAKEPSVLLLDEPLASLDPITRRALLGIVLSYAYEKTATILLSSHLVGDLERGCDHIVLLSNGTVLLSQTTEELLGSHFWAANSNENRTLIRRIFNSPSDYFIEMDAKLLVCSSNESLRYQLEARSAGLEEIVIARMTGKRVTAETTKASEA
jgi:ABC-2 type transport system ATP-binding protein